MSFDEKVNRLMNDQLGELRNRLSTAAGLPNSDTISCSYNGSSIAIDMPDWLVSHLQGVAPTPSGSSAADFIEGLKAWIVARQIPFESNDDLERLAYFYRWHISTFGAPPAYSGQGENLLAPALDEFEAELSERLEELIEDEINKVLCV